MSAGKSGSRRNAGSDCRKRKFASVPIWRLMLAGNVCDWSPSLRDIFSILLPIYQHTRT